MCQHQPPCPQATDSDRDAARVVVSYPEQGWSLLCNGVVVFDDTGELLPDGSTIAPHRPQVCRTRAYTPYPQRSVQTVVARFPTGTGSVAAARCAPRPGRSAA